MSIKTGLHRLAQVIKIVGALLVAAGILMAGYAAFTVRDGVKEGLVMLTVVGLPGVVLLAIAWILDGFAKE